MVDKDVCAVSSSTGEGLDCIFESSATIHKASISYMSLYRFEDIQKLSYMK
jgi:hypothetical protein